MFFPFLLLMLVVCVLTCLLLALVPPLLTLHSKCLFLFWTDQVVAVIIIKEAQSSQPEELLNVVSGSLPYARFLQETNNSTNSTTEAEVALVRKTLAWTTGIVLIIATYIGVRLDIFYHKINLIGKRY